MLCLLALLLVVLPFYHPYLLLSAKMRPVRAGVGSGLVLCAYWAAFWRLGRLLPGVPASPERLLSMMQVLWLNSTLNLVLRLCCCFVFRLQWGELLGRSTFVFPE